MAKIRLDQYLLDHAFAESREKAKAMIMEGIVYVNGQKSDKPGHTVPENCTVEVRGTILPYVSRGGLKLEKALRVFSVSALDRICLDCGASTGGFTDVLIQNGAARVYAVDVGYGQLAWKLRNDPRVINLERTNARYLTREQIPDPIELVVMDASFISLRLLFPAMTSLMKKGADLICLIKPQFEAGREKVGKKGVVRDPAVHREVLERFLSHAKENHFTVLGITYSPIRGPEGNIEYLGYLRKSGEDDVIPDLNAIVSASHAELTE
jgi:23S rRNA (cytidine1920-2'-O)/16S rRNA (cytidine1409-2'-O)-methyltransferase